MILDGKVAKFYTRCWNCGDEQDRIKSLVRESSMPNNGDISMCIQCGEFAIFDNNIVDGTRKPTPTENDMIRTSKVLMMLKVAWLGMREQVKREDKQKAKP